MFQIRKRRGIFALISKNSFLFQILQTSLVIKNIKIQLSFSIVVGHIIKCDRNAVF